MGNWLKTAKGEAEAQVGPRSIFNLRDQRNKTIRSFVPDYKEDLTGRARNPQKPEELGVIDRIKRWGGNVATNIGDNIAAAEIKDIWGGGDIDSEEIAYERWAGEEADEGRKVVPYDEYTAYRDIMDERPGEWTKVPQGTQNEDLIRKVVQEALKRNFGE